MNISGANDLTCYNDNQCPDEIVPNKSTSTTLRNTPLTYKHDSAGSFTITLNKNRTHSTLNSCTSREKRPIHTVQSIVESNKVTFPKIERTASTDWKSLEHITYGDAHLKRWMMIVDSNQRIT
ncbi:hypothetical protein MTP99_005959 [Tenebrio molitor]|jgi:hypothetical protein|nr:hypothetical protein MTP99_005959 [Tenebrio molitor]